MINKEKNNVKPNYLKPQLSTLVCSMETSKIENILKVSGKKENHLKMNMKY